MKLNNRAARHPFFYLTLAALTMFAGIVLRRVHLGLPPTAVKYGGSVLWAMMVYWIVTALRPTWQPTETAFVAALVAALVEFFKLYHAPAIDTFRHTVAGALLLGRYFSLLDIGVYIAAIVLAAWIDRRTVRSH